MIKLSLCLATHNEENNLAGCLDSAKALANEIIIVDGSSTDKTVEIAKKYGARVIITNNPPMFHINKQKALDECKGEWVLQLDADERVSPALAKEIKKVIDMSKKELEKYQQKLPERKLFLRHQSIIEKSEARNPKPETMTEIRNPNEQNRFDIRISSYVAFYLPRLNYFLGKFLRYGGVYPDGAIRLVKKGKAHFPCKDVHEVMEVDGKVGWLQNPLLHYDSPTFKRYLERNNRYIDLLAKELKDKSQIPNPKSQTNSNLQNLKFIENLTTFIDWMIIKPISWFLMTTFLYKGILDGWQGIVFSFFSALRFPKAYFKYLL